MGNDITPGHTYIVGETVTPVNLNEHVSESTIKETFISARALLDPVALGTKTIVSDGTLKHTTLQQIHDLILYPGSVVQTKYGEFAAFSIITSVIPIDDTIPQNTEGTEILSVPITPRFNDSTILCRFQGWHDSNPNNTNVVALFRSGSVNAIASAASAPAGTGWSTAITLEYLDSPATTSAVTYSIRFGPGAAGNAYFNGVTVTGRLLGGSARATLTLQEIKV